MGFPRTSYTKINKPHTFRKLSQERLCQYCQVLGFAKNKILKSPTNA